MRKIQQTPITSSGGPVFSRESIERCIIDINNWLVDVRELTEEQFQDIQDFRFLGNTGTKENHINTGEYFIGVANSKAICLKYTNVSVCSYETVKELFEDFVK